MIHNISFIKDFRTFVSGDEFHFKKGLNILVGDQGTGKSSLIQMLIDPIKDTCTLKYDHGKLYAFDFEKDNPRTKTSADQSKPGMLPFDVSARFKSHGQVNNVIIEQSKKAKNSVVFMDEPDCALSIKSIIKLIETLKYVAENNQVIISAHNPILINSVDEILDVENKTWIDSKLYLQNLGLNLIV